MRNRVYLHSYIYDYRLINQYFTLKCSIIWYLYFPKREFAFKNANVYLYSLVVWIYIFNILNCEYWQLNNLDFSCIFQIIVLTLQIRWKSLSPPLKVADRSFNSVRRSVAPSLNKDSGVSWKKEEKRMLVDGKETDEHLFRRQSWIGRWRNPRDVTMDAVSRTRGGLHQRDSPQT